MLIGVSQKTKAQNVRAEARLDLNTIRIGEQTKLRISLYGPVGAHAVFPKLTDTLAAKVLLVGPARIDTLFDKKNHSADTVTQSYTITGFDPGTYTIPSLSIGIGKSAVKTNELTLQVVTVKVDTTKAIYDIKQPIAVTYTFTDWLKDNWIIIASTVAVVLAILGTIYYLKKKPKKSVPIVVKHEPQVPVHLLILQKLEELRQKKLWQQDQVKAYYIELSDLLREYLEKRYDKKTHEKTTDEIFAALKNRQINVDHQNLLKQILVLSDLVKFAKEKPSAAQNEQSLDSAVSFITLTQQTEIQPATQGGNVKKDV
jgi:hypothetical protein